MTRRHIVFTGRVQHVGFRWTAVWMSRELYLTGWVDNRSDGSVEMEVQGPPLQIDRLIAGLEERFDIDDMRVERMDPLPQERGFRPRGY